MSEENKNTDCTPETFFAYNEAMGMLKVTNAQYSEDTKEVCELTVFSLLTKIYYLKDVYSKILEYMQQEGIYERYARAILEIQLNPPPPPQAQQSQSQESGEGDGQNNTENQNQSTQENQQKPQDKPESGGGVATEQHRSNGITREFLNNLFRDDDTF